MKFLKQLTIAVTACGFAFPGLASESRVIGWQDLAPEPVAYDNPFSALSPEQLQDLRKLLHLQQAQGTSEGTDPSEAAALRAAREADGLDPDALFEQRRIIIEKRREQATATNDAILGQTVRLPGYLLPLEINAQKAMEFLLVPTLGACIHTPPPPPNQLVHVRYPDGVAVKGLYTPIWVSGPLLSEYIVSGRCLLELDDGVTRELGSGDTVIQNGTRHAWRNPFAEPCVIVVALVGAQHDRVPHD